jgi:hypothetical protein
MIISFQLINGLIEVIELLSVNNSEITCEVLVNITIKIDCACDIDNLFG